MNHRFWIRINGFYEDGQRAFDGGVKEAGAKVTILGV